ncbi:MAG: hybrid sensor histidine kinase/response regulator, partial [Thermoanaerobaculia bacterium]
RALAERLTRTLESVADTFYTLDREYRFTYLNAAGEKLLQRPREELLGRILWDEFPGTRGTIVFEQYTRAMEEKVPVAFEFFYEPFDLWVDERAFPSEQGITVFVRDITEQKRARQSVEESEERFRLLFDKNPYPAWVYDLETLAFLAVNEAAVRQYGWSREEFLGMTIKDIRPPDTIPDLLRSIEDRPDDRTPLLEGVFTHLKKDGTAIEVEIASSPIALFGRPARLILATDVTERRRMEQQFLRAQRMESIGTLASGIAHDLNNLLMPVMMGVTLLRREGTSPAAARALENIERSARRGKDLVRQVLSFARGVEGSRVPVNVADIVREIRSIVESTFPKSISLAVDVPNDLWFIDADPTQINQILLNLCVNARDAMPAGGRLSISAKNAEIDEQYARMDQGVPAGRYVFVEVADEGTGIPKELQDRIFEPFYTTKEVGRGTGLGLSTVAAIVRAHGGSISVYSEPGEGTSFKIYLPAQEEKRVEAPAPADLATLPQGRGETILVVDDESAILAITQQTLETYGYRVFTAEDGAQAVGIWASHRDEIAVVITDMMMPIMDGPALIVALRRMDPTVKVIASSGLDDEPRTARAAQAGVAHFLQKPYTAETLLQMIRRAIDSRNGSS